MFEDTMIEEPFEELAFRASNGIEVALLWKKEENEVSVAVNDASTGDAFEIPVGAHSALDVFHHPYAYAAFTGVDYVVRDLQRDAVAA